MLLQPYSPGDPPSRTWVGAAGHPRGCCFSAAHARTTPATYCGRRCQCRYGPAGAPRSTMSCAVRRAAQEGEVGGGGEFGIGRRIGWRPRARHARGKSDDVVGCRSCEHAMQIPARAGCRRHRRRRGRARSGGLRHPRCGNSRGSSACVAAPPFGGDALGPFGVDDVVLLAAPGEAARRAIGNFRHA